MNIIETISTALSSITANKMRAAFTMFGIIVGIAAVMLITSVGDGFSNTITDQFEGMGMDEITISHTNATRPIEWHERLTLDDAVFLRNVDNLMAVTARSSVTFQNAVNILGTQDPRGVSMNGVDQYNFMFAGSDLIHGRHIMEQDVLGAANVVIIDEAFSRAAFGVTDSVGRELEVRTNAGIQRFNIIGILEADDSNMFADMFEMPYELFVPISVVQNILGNGTRVGSIAVRLEDTTNIHTFGDNLINIIQIRKGAQDVYRTFSMASALSQVDAVIGMFTAFLAMVASISLLVGGIGVMNIMLVSVSERTREIGIRKSLGATSGSITTQFLIEAAVLTALGGAIGIIFGFFGAMGIGYLVTNFVGMELHPVLNVTTVIVIVTLSAGIGILFGVYPARKASKLDPVESLRFE